MERILRELALEAFDQMDDDNRRLQNVLGDLKEADCLASDCGDYQLLQFQLFRTQKVLEYVAKSEGRFARSDYHQQLIVDLYCKVAKINDALDDARMNIQDVVCDQIIADFQEIAYN